MTYIVSWIVIGSPLKTDESVVMFPQSAYANADGSWTVPVHCWVVELEKRSMIRRIGRRAVYELLDVAGIVEQQTETTRFRERLDWFLADREINKSVTVQLDNRSFVSPRTRLNGHTRFEIQYCGSSPPGALVDCNVASLPEGSLPITGQAQLVPPTGISVISDIDDTIKISNVPNKRELVRGIFFDEYKPAAGMPGFYRSLAAQGCCFHYVSSSPWQLYPSLEPFMRKFFPFGSISQRHFYVADKSFIRFFRQSMDYKLGAVARLLEKYPRRTFVLIGDSGEKDPEIYVEIANRYAGRILAILIREIMPPIENTERWKRLTEQLPDGESRARFSVFEDPLELAEITEWLH